MCDMVSSHTAHGCSGGICLRSSRLGIGVVKLPWVDWFKHGMSSLLFFPPLIIIKATGKCRFPRSLWMSPLIAFDWRTAKTTARPLASYLLGVVHPNPSVSARDFFDVPSLDPVVDEVSPLEAWRCRSAALVFPRRWVTFPICVSGGGTGPRRNLPAERETDTCVRRFVRRDHLLTDSPRVIEGLLFFFLLGDI